MTKVYVVDYGKKNLMLRYKHPLTGKWKHKSAGTHKQREAERAAERLEQKLRKSAPEDDKIGWLTFRDRYEVEHASGLADGTRRKISTTLDAIERILDPDRLNQLNASRVSYFLSKLRDGKRSETTIKSYLSHLHAAMQWAVDVDLLEAVPKFPKIKRAQQQKKMKGRALATEEFERMLDKASDVVTGKQSPSWKYLLEGYWLSGLRLEEGMALRWDFRDDWFCVDFSDKFPMFHIPANEEKGHKDRSLPMAPEFAVFLSKTPLNDRTGFVFRPGLRRPKKSDNGRCTAAYVGQTISKIGEKANIKVSHRGKTKYASVHDLRRSFGTRWSPKVQPTVLMELMRHDNIETTLRYYVGVNSQSTASQLWNASSFGNLFGNLSENEWFLDMKENSQAATVK